MMRSRFRWALWGTRSWVAILLVFSLQVEARPDAAGPGFVDLAGEWRSHFTGPTSGDADGEPGAGEWQVVSLPRDGAQLGIASGGGSLWLEREVDLGERWSERLAPSGLAVLIQGPALGRYEVSVDGAPIGSWSHPKPGTLQPSVRVFEIPGAAIDQDGRLRLRIRWQWRGWALSRFANWQTDFGAGWQMGDQDRLRVEAELLQLRWLNADLPLWVLALLYAAIGAYHLQLFRRDRRCREYLWFGLVAIAVALHSAQFTQWMSQVSATIPSLRQLYIATGVLTAAIGIQFLWSFLGQPIGKLLRLYQGSLIAAAGLAAVWPQSWWTPAFEVICRSWGIPVLPLAAVLLVQELRRGTVEARTIAIGGFAIVAVGLAEAGLQLLGRGTALPLSTYAFALFAVSMAFSLSNRFSRVHGDLDLLRLQLEDMVEDRAAELSSANRRLESEISERELAQEAMRMLERAVEQSIDGIMVADLEDNTLFVNQAWARLHGRETFEIFGRRLDLFHNAEQLKDLRQALEHVQQEGSWEGEIAHISKKGTEFPTWTSVTLLRGAEAEPVGFVMVARDLSEHQRSAAEKKKIETRIQEAEKLRSLADLAGGIAHDYNNILTGVLGNSSLAQQELPTDSSAGDKLAQIGNAAERAAELTAQLLAYSGTETLVLQRTDLDQLLSDSRTELARVAGGNARLELQLDGALPEIEADSAQILHAVLNLIATAAAATPVAGEGKISLETGTTEAPIVAAADELEGESLPIGECVFLRVSDRGARGGGENHQGLEARLTPELGDLPQPSQGPSRDLGLAMVLATVRVHHGSLKVLDRPRGGSTYELLFPVAGERAEVTPDVVPPRRGWQGRGQILVVDDEYIMREVSRSILEQRGFAVLTAGEGKEAVELYRQHQASIRVTLLDRTMPTMPGEEVLARILEIDPEARVVLMSGFKRDAIVHELIEGGKADFLPKPFRPEELIEKVSLVLEGPWPRIGAQAD